MAVAKLKKAELFYHKAVREEIAEALQETGVCQIIESPDRESRPADVEARLSESEEQLSHVRYLLRTLTPHYNDPVSNMDRMLGERTLVSMPSLSKLARETDLSQIAGSIRKTEHEMNELKMEYSQLKANKELLERLSFFPHPLSSLTEGTRTLQGLTGTVKGNQLEDLRQGLENFSKYVELIEAPSDPKAEDVQVALLFSREKRSEILDVCAKSGLSLMDVPPSFVGLVKDEKEKLSEKLKELETQEANYSAQLDEAAEKWMPAIQELSDYWNSLVTRYSAIGGSDETTSTLCTRFWVPAKEASRVQKKLEAITPDIALFLSDPGEEDTPPTLLENGYFTRPANILTTLYSPPVYGGTDPTPLMTPFFLVFFGMCLGDAGYALVMLGVIGWLFKKYRRVPSSVRDFVVLFAFSAVMTFIYGVISGSFFGNFIDSFIPALIPLKNSLMLVDPMTNPMQVLGISLLMGVVHLMFGLLIAAYDNVRTGNPIDALGDNISWFLLITGLCIFGTAASGLLPKSLALPGKVMAIAGALIIFWYAGREKKNIFGKVISGFLALYGSTSYLGDILSYSRLLALGFGSAVIGMIINLLGGMSAEIPYVGWLVAIAVIAGGHIFSILINLLGAFVHPLRLQYVEFFGKFYTGGGESFEPLTHSGEFVEITPQQTTKA